MPEGGESTREKQRVLSPEERIVSDYAESAVRTLRVAARDYPNIKKLLANRTLSEDEMQIPTAELLGSTWNYSFIRHSPKYIDLEVKKTPSRVGGDLIEQAVRLRRPIDPLAGTLKLTQGKGVERYENEDDAYDEIDSFVGELAAQL